MPIDGADTPKPPSPPPDDPRQRPATPSERASGDLSQLAGEWRKENMSNAAEIVAIAPPGVAHDFVHSVMDAKPALDYLADLAALKVDQALERVGDSVSNAPEQSVDKLNDLVEENRGSGKATLEGLGASTEDGDIKLFFARGQAESDAIKEANRRELYERGR